MLGVRIGRIGRTSINYEIAIFTTDSDVGAAAQGTFPVVCADRTTRRPIPVLDGLAPEIKKDCHHLVQLSALTLPHAMAKVLLLEQIYRSAAIASNHPYHRD